MEAGRNRLVSVASESLGVAAGAQQPQRRSDCMKIMNTTGRRQRLAQQFQEAGRNRLVSVASKSLGVAAGARQPQCRLDYMRIASTTGRRQRLAQ